MYVKRKKLYQNSTDQRVSCSFFISGKLKASVKERIHTAAGTISSYLKYQMKDVVFKCGSSIFPFIQGSLSGWNKKGKLTKSSYFIRSHIHLHF